MAFIHIPHTPQLPELSADTSEAGRFYTTPEGNVYPSITTVLSVLGTEYLDAWRTRIGEDVAREITRKAGERGDHLHAVLESYVKNEELTFPTDPQSKVRIMFNRMKRPLTAFANNIVAQEIPLYSDELKIAGRCDMIGDWKKVLSIIDFKGSTKSKRKDWIQGYFMQATGYSLMFEERTGIQIDTIVILMCSETDFACQIFEEDRKKFIEPLKDTIKKYHAQ